MSSLDLYFLDTNTVSYLVKMQSEAARKAWATAEQTARIAISAITEAELRFGLEKNPAATRLRDGVMLFCASVEILPWDSAAAHAYGILRRRLMMSGKALAELDLLIAAHAMSQEAILVTTDKAFDHLKGSVEIVNWATDLG